jgi:mannose-1-phosphate guanylyltransferase
MSAKSRIGKKAAGTGLDLRAVILAGGRGTRFWPLGRSRRPKQFLNLTGSRPLAEETVRRVAKLVPPDRVALVADAGLTRALRRIFPGLPKAAFVVEPAARNTAPAVLLATARVFLENPEAVVAVLPADHLIRDRARFLKKLRAAAEAAFEEGALVVFGVPPAYPATGYGYVRVEKRAGSRHHGEAFFSVRAFKEKPDRKKAERFLASGNYLWNSGMFVWRADAFARELAAADPTLFAVWERILAALKKKDPAGLVRAYAAAPATSIDYALMEKARRVLACRGDFGWSDVGSWSALYQVWERDAAGNACRGDSVVIDSRDCLVWNPGGTTALVGARDLIVVRTEDALLVCAADSDQKVREAVEILKKRRKSRLV